MLAAQDLDREKVDVAIRDPFFIFEFHDLFEPETYDVLDAKFPTKSVFPASWVDRGGKSHMTSKMPEFAAFMERTPIWKQLYDRFADPEVIGKLHELTHSVPSERPAREKKQWRINGHADSKGFARKPIAQINRLKSNLLGYTPVRLAFEFSYLEAGCYIPPHTDVPGKLISLMLYFPDVGVEYPTGAGTEFYRGKNNAPAQSAWKVGMLEDDPMREFLDKHEAFYTSEFAPNKLVGFIKTSLSWHGVRHLELPKNATRRSLNINYYLA